MDERIFSQLGTWQAFDPAWLVRLAADQLPDHPQIAQALAECKRCCAESASYVQFVDPQRPQPTDSPWQFATTVTLRDPELGHLCLDVLVGGRIGGLEILDRIEA